MKSVRAVAVLLLLLVAGLAAGPAPADAVLSDWLPDVAGKLRERLSDMGDVKTVADGFYAFLTVLATGHSPAPVAGEKVPEAFDARRSPAGRRLSSRNVAASRARVQVPDAYLRDVMGLDPATGSRRLAEEAEPPCSGRGVVTQLNTTTYTCGGIVVTQAFHDAAVAAEIALPANITIPGVGTTPLPANATANCTSSWALTDVCACPLDYAGSECETARDSVCEVLVEDEAYNSCLAAGGTTYGGYDPQVGGDPPCWMLRQSSTLPQLRVSCRFTSQPTQCNGTAISADALQSGQPPPFYGLEGCLEGNFTYWTRTENSTFALSEVQAPPSITVRPVNFVKLTDAAGSKTVALTADQVAGNEPVQVSFALGDLHSRFQTMGRVYLELRVDKLPGQTTFTATSMIGDVEGYSEPTEASASDDTTRNVLIVLIVIFAIIIAVLLYWKYFRDPPPAAQASVIDAKHKLT